MIFNILLSLLSMPAAHAMTLCNNTLFSSPSAWGGASGSWFSSWVENGIPLPVSPIEPPPSIANTCTFYSKKKEVCCSDETLSDIALSVTAAQAAIATAVAVLKDEKHFAQQIVGIVGPAINTFCDPPLLPGNMCNKLTNTVTTYTNRIIDDATKIATDQATCANALVTYAGGLVRCSLSHHLVYIMCL
jgi:hypothetical protein